MRRRGRWLASGLGGILAVATAVMPSHASIFDTYGKGARGTALGGSLVALSATYEAVYYNPANLLAKKANHLGISVSGVFPMLSLEPSAPDASFQPLLPSLNGGLTLGISVPFGGVLKNKVGLGVTFFHPLGKVTRVESIDPATPYFYRYQSLPSKFILAAALAAEPVPWLRFGIGTQVLAELGGRVHAALSLSERRFTYKEIDLDVKGSAALTAGVSVGPFYGLRFGATWRSALKLQYVIPINVELEEVGTLSFFVDGVSLYTPDQLALGLSWESHPGKRRGLAVELGLTWERWSAAPPAVAIFELAVTNDALVAPENVQNLIESRREPRPLEARDIVIPRLGVEYRPTPMWAVRAGYFYRATPLPVPVYDTNTVDATAHVISLGGGFTFADPTKISRHPLTLDLAIQLTALKPRRIPKVASVDYRASGVIWYVALDLRHNY